MAHTQLHSASLTAVSLALAIGCLFGLMPDPAVLILAGFFGLLIIGLPHGGLDHRVGTRLLRRWGWPAPLSLFIALYLLMSAAVLAGWYLWPGLTVMLFFLLSAWHFGLEEDDVPPANPRQSFARFSQGAMIIWVPSLFQATAVTSLLQTTMPSHHAGLAETVVMLWGQSWPIWSVGLLILLLGRPSQTASTRQQPPKATTNKQNAASNHSTLTPTPITWLQITRSCRVLAFGLLFAVADPLLAFTVYFCGWHSVRGLRQLYRTSGQTTLGFLRDLLPISLAAISLFLLGFGFYSSQLSWWDSMIRVSFIGLSAVAIPHLLLHVVNTLTTPSTAEPGPHSTTSVASPSQWSHAT